MANIKRIQNPIGREVLAVFEKRYAASAIAPINTKTSEISSVKDSKI